MNETIQWVLSNPVPAGGIAFTLATPFLYALTVFHTMRCSAETWLGVEKKCLSRAITCWIFAILFCSVFALLWEYAAFQFSIVFFGIVNFALLTIAIACIIDRNNSDDDD